MILTEESPGTGFYIEMQGHHQRVHSTNTTHKTCAFGNPLTVIMTARVLDIQNCESLERELDSSQLIPNKGLRNLLSMRE